MSIVECYGEKRFLGRQASQAANPVCVLRGAIVDQVPGAFLKNLILAKAAWNALGAPGIKVVHQVEVQVWSCRVAGMADIGQRLAWGDLVSW